MLENPAKKSGNRLLLNMLTYAILQVVNTLVGLFLPRLFLKVYGSEINGVISTVNGFITYFHYLEAGIGLTLIHSLFKPLATGDTEELNGILSFSKKQYQKISLIYLILVVALSLVFPFLRICEDLGTAEFMGLVFVIGFYGALDFFTMAKYRVLLTADRKEYVISIAGIIAQGVRFVAVWALLTLNLSVVLVKIVPILTLFIRSFILYIYVKRKYPEANFKVPPTKNIETVSHRWDALTLQISISTSTALPAIIVSQVLGYEQANVYAVYALVANALIMLISALSSGVSPMLGRSIAKGENINKTYDIYDCIVSYIITVTFAVSAVMLIPFIKIYTNVANDVEYVYPIYALLISIWGASYSYRIPLTAVINAAAIYKQNRLNNIVNLLIQVVGGVVATLLFGIIGLMAVMIIAAVHRNVAYTHVNSKNLLHNGLKKSLIRQILMYGIIVASYLVGYNIIKGYNFTFITWGLVAALVLVVFAVITLVVYAVIDGQTVKEILLMVKSKLFRKKKKA